MRHALLLKKILTIFFICSVIISVAVTLRTLFLTPRSPIGSLQINSLPKTTVFINDKQIGQTPITQEKIPAGEYKIKLVTANNNSWESTVLVMDGALTFVSREIGDDPQDSSGIILTAEKVPISKQCEMVMIADPPDAILLIDGLEKGKATSTFKNLSCGEKVLAVSAYGHSSQTVKVRLTPGFRLNAIVKLRRLSYLPPHNTQSLSLPSEDIASKSAVVSQTPTGFLRVRAASSSAAPEIGRLLSGETVWIISQPESDWVKIKFKDSEGWVFREYLQF